METYFYNEGDIRTSPGFQTFLNNYQCKVCFAFLVWLKPTTSLDHVRIWLVSSLVLTLLITVSLLLCVSWLDKVMEVWHYWGNHQVGCRMLQV